MAIPNKILVIYRVNEISKSMSGVFNKFKGQLDAFNKRDIEVYALYMSGSSQLLSRFENSKFEPLEKLSDIAVEDEYHQFWLNAKRMVNEINPQVVYVRYDQMFGRNSLTEFLTKCRKLGLLVYLEFPTYPYDKEITCSVRLDKERKSRECLSSLVSKCFSTSKEEYIFNIKNFFFENSYSLGDGNKIDLSRPLIGSNGVQLITVANLNNWHGIDRLLEGIALFKSAVSSDKFHYHIVGEGAEYLPLKKLAKSLDIQKHVTFHGFLFGESLRRLLSQCSVGIGSLGLHRLGLEHSSTLKNREYMSAGLPIVYANPDPVLDQFDWKFQVDQNETPIDIKGLIAFAKYCNTDRDVRYRINDYAKRTLSWNQFADHVLKHVREDLRLK